MMSITEYVSSRVIPSVKLRQERDGRRLLPWQGLMPVIMSLGVMLCILGMSFVSGGFNPAVAAEAPGEAVTVKSRIRVDSVDPDGIVLAGFVDDEDGLPIVLTLTWAPVPSDWFGPMWGLQLQSSEGLLRPESQGGAGDKIEKSTIFRDCEYINLTGFGTIKPEEGHEYETVLSYHKASGSVAILLTDVTTGKILFTKGFTLAKYDGPLYATAGYKAEAGKLGALPDAYQEGFTVVKTFEAYDMFLPVNLVLRVVSRDEASENFVSVSNIDRRLETSVQIDNPWKGIGGELVYRIEKDGDGEDNGRVGLVTRRVTLKETEGRRFFDIPVSDLPAGRVRISMSYEDQGRSFKIAEADYSVGAITLETDFRIVGAENGKLSLEGEIHIDSDGPFPAMVLEASSVIQDVGVKGAVIETGDYRNEIRLFEREVRGISKGRMQIPFKYLLKVPEEGEIYKISVKPKIRPSVSDDIAKGLVFGLKVFDKEDFLAKRRGSAFPKVGEYTVLRGDFHIHTTRSDGRLTPTARVLESYQYGYDVIAITDHRNFAAYDEVKGTCENLGLILLRGMETGMLWAEHLNAIGFSADYQPRDPHGWGMSKSPDRAYYRDQLMDIKSKGGLVIFNHPDFPKEMQVLNKGLREPVQWGFDNRYIEGVEVRNDTVHWLNSKATLVEAFEWALKYNLTIFANTDIHKSRAEEMVNGKQTFTLVFVTEETPEGVMEALKARRTVAWFDGMLWGREELMRKFMDALVSVSVEEERGSDPAAGGSANSSEKGRIVTIKNNGPAELEGRILGGGEGITFKIGAYGEVSLNLEAGQGPVGIRWENVWISPEERLEVRY